MRFAFISRQSFLISYIQDVVLNTQDFLSRETLTAESTRIKGLGWGPECTSVGL